VITNQTPMGALRAPKNALYSIIFIFLLISLSCATMSPVDNAREIPAASSQIATIIPKWQPIAFNNSHSGVYYFPGKNTRPRIDFWALRIDLQNPDLFIVVRGGQSSVPTTSTRVTSFVRDNGLLAGINATPFDYISVTEGKAINNIGIVISDGVVIAPPHTDYYALVFDADGKVSIIKQAEMDLIENIHNAIGGFHGILKNYQLTDRALGSEARHPRSAAGICTEGKYLYLLVVDGRRKGSIGTTEAETALILRALGAVDGINFDGGGSSTLAVLYPDGKVRPVNTPIHGGIHGMERAVAGCLGVRILANNYKN